MPTYVALLRGINLGRRRVQMSRLKELFEELRLANVATFIASGNVIFETTARDIAKLEHRIEKHLRESLGYEVDTFIRSAGEIAAVIDHAPFSAAQTAGCSYYVFFLREPLPRDTAARLAACSTSDDVFHLNGREIYWLCRTSVARSEIWAQPEVKALRLPTMTMRNITSLQKLVEKHRIAG